MINSKKKKLIKSIARSMEAEGFDFAAVKKTIEAAIEQPKA